MATKLPKTADTAAAAGDVVVEATKAVQDIVEAQVEAVAEPVVAAIEETAPAIVPADVVTAPAEAAKRVAKAVKAKVTPVRKAVVKAAKPVVVAKPVIKTKPVIKKAAKAVITAARTVAPPASKEPTIMATVFETPKLLTDLNERTKTAVEKSQKFAAEFGDFSKGNIEAIVESGKITAKGLETLGQETADYTRKSFEGMTATLKSLASVKSPTDFFKLQSDYVRSAFDSAVAQSSKNTEAMIKLANDAAQPISSRFAVAVEKVKAAA